MSLTACVTDISSTPFDEPDRPRPFEMEDHAAACEKWDEWDKPAPPVRVLGGTYLVGTCGITAVLVTTAEGHILIDAGTEEGGKLVAENIEKLGLSLRHVTTLTHSHEHHDHVGGMAWIKQATGAMLVASEPAQHVFETGTLADDDPQAGMHDPFPAVTVDETITDGQTLELGGIVMVAHATPGHTPGALSWQWVDCDGDECRSIVYADSLSPISRDDYRFSDHPEVVDAYRAGLDRLAQLDCDILLTPHPSASDMIDRMSTGALVDPEGCRAYAEKIGARLDARLAREAEGE